MLEVYLGYMTGLHFGDTLAALTTAAGKSAAKRFSMPSQRDRSTSMIPTLRLDLYRPAPWLGLPQSPWQIASLGQYKEANETPKLYLGCSVMIEIPPTGALLPNKVDCGSRRTCER
jgi:hypothetical protein